MQPRIDQQVNRRFWSQRALAGHTDPRTVTLDSWSAAHARRHVGRQQRWMLRRLDIHGCRFDSIADLGCGLGDWTIVLARRARRLLAVDLAQGFVDVVRARVEQSGAPVDAMFVCSHLASVRLPTELDLVVFGAVVQYLDDDDLLAVLENIHASMRPTGLLYVRTTVSQRRHVQATSTASYQAIYRPASWYASAFERAGFQLVESADLTDLIADEVAHDLVGPRAIGGPLAWMIRTVRRLYRRPRRLGVRVWILRKRTRALAP